MTSDRRAIRTATVWLLAFLLTGCGGLVVVQETGSADGSRGWNWFNFSQGGRLPLRVLGNPTARNQDQFETRLASLMSQSVFGNPVEFDPAPGATAPYGQSVVMLFGSDATNFAIDPCERQDSAPPQAARNPIVVFAALCIDNKSLRTVRGRVDVADGDTDRALDAVISEVLLALTRRRGVGGGGDSGAGGGG
jgi:hypothetical protein